MLTSPVRAAVATTGVGRVGSIPRRPTGRCASLGTRKKTVAPAAASSSTRITTHTPRSERRFSVIRWLSIFIWNARFRPAPHPASFSPITAEKCNSPISQGGQLQQDVTAHRSGRLRAGRMPSMPIPQIIEGGRVPVKVFTDDLEARARAQLANLAQLPIVFGHVAAMPDVHAGIGATVGSVIPTRRAIIPAAVGVDIGCGMNAVQLSLGSEQLPDSLARVRTAIERAVPVGFDEHRESDARRDACAPLKRRLERVVRKHPKIAKMQRDHEKKWVRQMGSLGGGNHFIEVCLDESERLWVMLHSGSRGIGNCIGQYFIAQARQAMQKRDVHLPDRDLAWFDEGSDLFDDYVEAVGWAQDYAFANRGEMLELILEALRRHLPAFEVTGEAINCHHNYVQQEEHFGERVYVTRKGAISAREGELGIIPGSMGARSYIVRGKGNPESFCSCAHGAGRRMSRNEAKRRFSRADLIAQTRGVECRKDKGVLDEIPGAYKDIDQVMADQTDLVDVAHTLKQVVCVKG